MKLLESGTGAASITVMMQKEVADRIDAGHRGDARARSDLGRKTDRRLMEDGLAVGSHQVGVQVIPLQEIAHLLSQVQAVIGMKPGVLLRRQGLGRGQFLAKLRRIIHALSLQDPVVPGSVKLEGYAAKVQPVERSA